MIADGNSSYGKILNELYNQIDYSKITSYSYMRMRLGHYQLFWLENTTITYCNHDASYSNGILYTFVLKSSDSKYWSSNNGSSHDSSSTIVPAGWDFYVYY